MSKREDGVMNQLKNNGGQFYNNNKGIMLIGLIVVITIVGIMSAGSLYLMSGSTQTSLFANANSRAYYLAESGINYAKLNVGRGKSYKAATKFNLDNGDAFIIKTELDPQDPSRTIIYSTGIVNPGSWLESKYDITSNFIKSGGIDLSEVVGLTTENKKGKLVLNPIWSIKGQPEIEVKKDIGKAGLGFTSQKGPKKSKEGEKGKKIQTYLPILLSLGWWKTSPEKPDLDQTWSDYNGLLSYEVQVKVKLGINGGHGDHFMHGISFRLSPKSPGWADSNTFRSYGISYFKSKNLTWPFDIDLDNSFKAIMNNFVYIVLWEKISSSNTLSLIDYRKLTKYDGVLDGSDLKDWATIFLRLEEKFDGPNGTRQNHITGFFKGSANPALGKIDWDSGNYNIVQWKNNYSGHVLADSLTTTNFSVYKPDELGLHAFYDSNASDKQYFTDFSLRLGTGPSFQW